MVVSIINSLENFSLLKNGEDISQPSETLMKATNTIEFPKGLVGFDEYHAFSLKSLGSSLAPLLQLVCEDREGLNFYVVPVDLDSDLIAKEDIDQVIASHRIPMENLVVLYIISVRQEDGHLLITANMRAPIVINVHELKGWQYIFAHSRYEVKGLIAKVPL